MTWLKDNNILLIMFWFLLLAFFIYFTNYYINKYNIFGGVNSIVNDFIYSQSIHEYEYASDSDISVTKQIDDNIIKNEETLIHYIDVQNFILSDTYAKVIFEEQNIHNILAYLEVFIIRKFTEYDFKENLKQIYNKNISYDPNVSNSKNISLANAFFVNFIYVNIDKSINDATNDNDKSKYKYIKKLFEFLYNYLQINNYNIDIIHFIDTKIQKKININEKEIEKNYEIIYYKDNYFYYLNNIITKYDEISKSITTLTYEYSYNISNAIKTIIKQIKSKIYYYEYDKINIFKFFIKPDLTINNESYKKNGIIFNTIKKFLFNSDEKEKYIKYNDKIYLEYLYTDKRIDLKEENEFYKLKSIDDFNLLLNITNDYLNKYNYNNFNNINIDILSKLKIYTNDCNMFIDVNNLFDKLITNNIYSKESNYYINKITFVYDMNIKSDENYTKINPGEKITIKNLIQKLNSNKNYIQHITNIFINNFIRSISVKFDDLF